MRSLLVICLLFLSTSVLAQFTPLCDDGMGGYAACTGVLNPSLLPTIPSAKLPIVPTSKGGTGTDVVTPGRYFTGSGALKTPSFVPIDRRHIPGITIDYTATPQPMLEVSKDLGTGPQMIARFPGDGGTFNRWYVGQRGMYFAFNCSTGDGVTCLKDSTAVPSAVFEMGNGSILRWAIETRPAVSTWRTDNAQRAMEWRGTHPYWSAALGDGTITAWAGGTVRGARVGDTLHFPVQWPARLSQVPTKFTFGSTKTVGTTGAVSISNADDAGAVLNVDVGSNGDFTWIGQVVAGN